MCGKVGNSVYDGYSAIAGAIAAIQAVKQVGVDDALGGHLSVHASQWPVGVGLLSVYRAQACVNVLAVETVKDVLKKHGLLLPSLPISHLASMTARVAQSQTVSVSVITLPSDAKVITSFV